MHLRMMLFHLMACEGATHWAADYYDFQEAWDECERGDWMLWLLRKLNVLQSDVLIAAAQATADNLPEQYVCSIAGIRRNLRDFENPNGFSRLFDSTTWPGTSWHESWPTYKLVADVIRQLYPKHPPIPQEYLDG